MKNIKDDYLDMALNGKTAEEKYIGSVMTALFNFDASTGDDFKTYEIYLTYALKPEVRGLLKERLDNLRPFWDACARWRADHDIDQDPKNYDHYKQMGEEITPIFRKNLDHAGEIYDEVMERKYVIFKDLGSRLRSLMVRLRSLSLLQMEIQNYAKMRQMIKESHIRNQNLEKMVSEYSGLVIDFGKKYSEDPASDEARIAFEEANHALRGKIYPVLREEYDIKTTEFQHDGCNGRMGGSYFFGFDDLLRHFDYMFTPNEPNSKLFFAGRGKCISFSLGGMLEGSYRLEANPGFVFKEVEGDIEYYSKSIISPVQLSIQLPQCYDKIVQPVFDKIVEDYGNRVVPESELRKCR